MYQGAARNLRRKIRTTAGEWALRDLPTAVVGMADLATSFAAGSAFCISIASCLPMSPVERVWRVLVLGLSDSLSFLLRGNNVSLLVYLGRESLFETDISMKMIYHTDISKCMQKIPLSFICR